MRLYDFNNEFMNLRDMTELLDYDHLTGEIIDNSEVIKELWNELSLSLETKLENAAYLIKEIDVGIDALRAEADRLTKKARMMTKNQDRIRELMQFALKASEQDKVKTNKFTFSLRKSSSLEIDEMVCPLALMPKQFVRTKSEFDKTAITKALKAGEVIDGCVMTEKESLQIR